MAVVRTLGKNTLGDNNKMKVAMRDYDMSTHDISTVFRPRYRDWETDRKSNV